MIDPPRPPRPDSVPPHEPVPAVPEPSPPAESGEPLKTDDAVHVFSGSALPVDGPAEPVSALEARPAEVEPSETHLAAKTARLDAEPEPTASSVAGPDAVSVPPPSSSGMTGLLGSGLLGGIVGAGLALAAQALWLSPAGRTDERLAQLEQRAGSAATSQETAQATARRLTAIETDLTAQNDRVRATAEAADNAGKRADAVANRPPPPPDPAQAAALAQAQTRLDGLERAAGDRVNAGREAQAALDKRLIEQDGRIAGLARQLAEAGPQRLDAVSRLVAADGLQAALREGRPLGPYLPTLEKLKTSAPILAAFQPYRDAPAPSASALARDFKPVAETIAAGQRPPPADWTGRLVGIASEIVSIRPLDGSADAPGAAGRVESALTRGEFASATTAWDSLPEPARRSASAFGENLKKRAAADAAAQKLSGEALASFEAAAR